MSEKLWEHPSPQTTKTHQFKTSIEQKYDIQLKDYGSLRQWSIDNHAQFWEEVWHFTGIRASAPFTKVGLRSDPMHVFAGNVALLYCSNPSSLPILADLISLCRFLAGYFEDSLCRFQYAAYCLELF